MNSQRHRRTLAAISILALCLWSPASAGQRRWPAGLASAPPLIGVPKLTEPFVVDGQLDEWASGLATPCRAVSLSIYLQGDHEWLGPDDASMESFIAWNADGICVAVAAWDNELVNDQPPQTLWNEDCVTAVVETQSDADRAPDDPPIPGVRFLIVPPRGDEPARIFDPARAKSPLTYKVKRHTGGYTVEALIPWSMLDDITPEPGTPLFVRFSMIDYDNRDGDQVVPYALTWHPSWYQSPYRRPPGKTAPAVLVDALVRSPETDLESEVLLDVDNCPPVENPTVPITIDLGLHIGREAQAVELLIDDWRSERAVTQKLDLTSTDSALGAKKSAAFTWSLDDVPYGQYTITARILNAKGDSLGSVRRDVLIARGFTAEVLGRIEKANIGAIVKAQPFLAVDWLAAAANLERFRTVAAGRYVPATGFQARELTARLHLLESGKPSADGDDMFDLLALTADPEAQVTVDFWAQDQAQVTICWGAAPIAAVGVQQVADAESARNQFEAPLPVEAELTTLGGKAARIWQPSEGLTGVAVLTGRRIIRVTSPSAEVARRAAAAVAAGVPISLAQTDAMCAALAKEIEDLPLEEPIPEGMKLFVGDTHTHTFFSDGSYSPIYVTLLSLASSMDFVVLTDHNNVDGARLAAAYCKRYEYNHNVIVGQEITMSWAHLNGYPLGELVDAELPAYDLVRNAHAQGAVVQWNHPSEGSGKWAELGFSQGLGPLGVEAWEHVPAAYEQWRKTGRLPVLVGSTDMHLGYFTDLERSIILAPSAGAVDVAEAVRRGNVCIIQPTRKNVVYGAPHMIHLARAALLEGNEFRSRRADYLRSVLANVDITGLITTSPQRRVTTEQANELLQALKDEQQTEGE
ncbi:hypothetical protein LCGC14_0161870 [marine sediment metagenome]|uniref:Polymerase/histidinol phosphatase N-terminal domain-containing protein n=1 Tax=marine sediment metagenome TaxID=412755 RepID=A0A0F9VB00_9ZZZZ|nr:hypothetical protein [Phycisphaerae bacterium]HDZ45050.1 hypothetical protein [Phycisphaerae bacterium]